MSFEDIEEARAKRTTKEVIKGKGQRGRKRKSSTLEAGEPELEPEVARATREIINSRGGYSRKRRSATLEADEPEPELEPEVTRTIEAPELWKALVA
jgi:hypothetical protein